MLSKDSRTATSRTNSQSAPSLSARQSVPVVFPGHKDRPALGLKLAKPCHTFTSGMDPVDLHALDEDEP
jgi:hypothetical protein